MGLGSAGRGHRGIALTRRRDVAAAVARGDQHGGKDRAEDREPCAEQERRSKPLVSATTPSGRPHRTGSTCACPRPSRASRDRAPRDLLRGVDRPQCETPASCGRAPRTAAIVTGHERQPETDRGEKRRAEDVGQYEPSCSRDLGEPREPARDQRHPDEQQRLEPEAGRRLRRGARRHDDPDRQWQVQDAGVDRENPSTSCRSSEMKKNMENSDVPISSPMTFAPRRSRSRKIENGISGSRCEQLDHDERRQQHGRAGDAAIVAVDPQPELTASTTA